MLPYYSTDCTAATSVVGGDGLTSCRHRDQCFARPHTIAAMRTGTPTGLAQVLMGNLYYCVVCVVLVPMYAYGCLLQE